MTAEYTSHRNWEGGINRPPVSKGLQLYAATGTSILWRVEVTTSEV